MIRYLIKEPKRNTYVRVSNGGWTSGHDAEEVNSYSSYDEAVQVIKRFDGLHDCQIARVNKIVQIIDVHHVEEKV